MIPHVLIVTPGKALDLIQENLTLRKYIKNLKI